MAHGPAAVPPEWLDAVEGTDIITQAATDAATELRSPPSDDDYQSVPDDWWHRYPGW